MHQEEHSDIDEKRLGGNVVVLGDSFIAGLSDSFGAKPHRHPALELYAACDGASHVEVGGDGVAGAVVVVAPNALHRIVDAQKRGLAVFLDPLTSPGFDIWHAMPEEAGAVTAEALGAAKPLAGLMDEPTPASILAAAGGLVESLGGRFAKAARLFSQPVLSAIDFFVGDETSFDLDDVAAATFLSKSRLAHLFSEQTGITLKDYAKYKRMEAACRAIVRGSTITEASAVTGFSTPSHIAVSSQKLTGMQLSRMLGL